MLIQIDETGMIKRLYSLEGIWKGSGTARFPTIETIEYFEELEFRFTGDDESMRFEQRSWHIINNQKGKPLHFESGFIIAGSDGSFELLNAQNSSRVEVLKCIDLKIENFKTELTFESKYFGNDERMIKTQREYFINGNKLSFRMCMATNNTPQFQEHLRSVLEKASA